MSNGFGKQTTYWKYGCSYVWWLRGHSSYSYNYRKEDGYDPTCVPYERVMGNWTDISCLIVPFQHKFGKGVLEYLGLILTWH